MWQAYLSLAWTIVPVMIVVGAFFVVRVLRELEAQHRTLAAMAERLARSAAAQEGPEAPPRAESVVDVSGIQAAVEALGDRLGAELKRERDASDRHLSELAERLEALAAKAAEPPEVAPAVGPADPAPSETDILLERATNRLVAEGYEQIDFVTQRDEVGPDSALIVEARRHGMVHKGRVALCGGSVTDVDLRPAHGFFP